MKIKEAHEIKDFEKVFEESEKKTSYLSWKKIESGEQKRVWGGIFKKVYLKESDYGIQKNYVFKTETGDFVLGASKLVDSRMSCFRIGDYVRIEYKGRKLCAPTSQSQTSTFKYVDYEFSRSISESFKSQELLDFVKTLMAEQKNSQSGFDTTQPFPESIKEKLALERDSEKFKYVDMKQIEDDMPF